MPARSAARTGTERRLRSELAASRLCMPARSAARTGMSKERAQARALRQAEAARRGVAAQARRDKATAASARRERRALAWRQVRLWQHGSTFRNRKDGWAALGTLAMVLLLLAYLLTSSFQVVFLVVLVLVIAGPALVCLLYTSPSPRDGLL